MSSNVLLVIKAGLYLKISVIYVFTMAIINFLFRHLKQKRILYKPTRGSGLKK